MIVFATLPADWNHRFIPMEINSNRWAYSWELKEAPKLKIYTNNPQPWGKNFYIAFTIKKTNPAKIANRLELHCYKERKENFNRENIHSAEILMYDPIGGIPHTFYSTLRFYAIPWENSNFREHIFLTVRKREDTPLL